MPPLKPLTPEEQTLITHEEQREVRLLRHENTRLRDERRELLERLDLLNRLEEARVAPPKWLVPKVSGKGHRGTVSLLSTDTHFDEVVRPEEINFLNAYNREIATQRLRRFYETSVIQARDYVSGVVYDGCVLFKGGDIFSGNIHEELIETNHSTLYDAIVYWLGPEVAGIRLLADAFGKVHVPCVIGNHGRRTKKPRAKFRAQDNIDWLFYKLLAREFAGDSRVTFQIPDAADALVTVYNTTYLLTHGDQFRGGSGISAALSPLMLGSHRKTKSQIAAGKPYQVMVHGHWHRFMPLIENGLLGGGTLKGYDEYAAVSNFEFAPASQAFWVTDPDCGATFLNRILVTDRKLEGW